ncbi:MAG: tetratricopeptide repeat protein [Syntrophales bacterium]
MYCLIAKTMKSGNKYLTRREMTSIDEGMNLVTKKDDFDLHLKPRFPNARKYVFALFSLAIALLVVYSNSFHGEWHFDDIDNIINNPNVHIKTFTWEALDRCFHGIDYPYWIRPLSYLSFALNYHYDGLNVFGYHIVNFAVHYLTAGFIFLFIFKLLQLPLLKDRYGVNAYSIAILATFLWALNPTQVSTVSYIVQRMAGLAGLFTIMVMYFYLAARTTEKRAYAIGLFIVSFVLALLGFAAKENMAMLPFTLFLFDLFMIQGISKATLRKNIVPGLLCALLVVLIGLAYTGFASLSGQYENIRPFTMWERLLTQPRVILYYIGLLLYPANVRLMLLHDMDFSKSILDPWTTMPAIGIVLMILAFAILMSRKRPLISFCIIFFFLNHLIEGSFIALELVYEHRNYVPAMLFFVPLAVFILNIIDHFSYRRSLQGAVAGGAILILVFWGDSTYTRNEIFRTEINLWMDNAEKAPRMSRPHNNLGGTYWVLGRYDDAFREFSTASQLNREVNIPQLGIVQMNLGLYYLEIKGQPDLALQHFRKAIARFPDFPRTYTAIAKAHLMAGDVDKAYDVSLFAAKKFPRNPEFRQQLSFILLKAGRLEDSIAASRAILREAPDSIETYPVMGEAFRRRGELPEAIRWWHRYEDKRPESVRSKLALIEIYGKTKNSKELDRTIDKLWSIKKEKSLSTVIEEAASHPATKAYLPEKKILIPLIRQALDERLRREESNVTHLNRKKGGEQ